jgi:seryl-tRNA synthetase
VERSSFRNDLIASGLLVDAGVDGLYLRSFLFESVVRGVQDYVSRSAETPHNHILYFPPVMARSTLTRTGYVRSFPNLTGSISSFAGNDRDLPALMAALDSDDEWSEFFTPTNIVTCSAACHPLYPVLEGATLPSEGVVYEVQGTCFRHEPSMDVGRMQSFRQYEIVFVGGAGEALQHRESWLNRGFALLSNLGLGVELVEANDPFFGRAGLMLASGQRDKKLKFEIVAEIGSQEPGAIASGNLHESHFGSSFNISQHNGEVAHSACIGFGLERITLALIAEHGVSVSDWPHDVLDTLELHSKI